MNVPTTNTETGRPLIGKSDWNKPALIATGREAIAIRAGTRFAGMIFDQDTPIAIKALPLEPGTDYAVTVRNGAVCIEVLSAAPTIADPAILGGFYFAPGGNAAARSGGDSVPAINPCSLWDVGFRPACPDPRGMAFVHALTGPCWLDICLLGKDHMTDGTSRLGVTIADGNDPPQDPTGGYFRKLDYAVADAVMKHHGKTLASVIELFAGAFGVTEKTSCGVDPCVTKLDAARTSQIGLVQPAGSMWQWCHDGDPDEPRPSLFGGSWFSGDYAGSRYAFVAYYWPGSSSEFLGARGRSDHLQLA